MKKMMTLAALGLLFVVSAPAFAGAQQNKMKTCNKEATGKKGDERKAFMKECLSNKGVAPAAAASPACENKAAERKLAGAAKNNFMKKCERDAAAK